MIALLTDFGGDGPYVGEMLTVLEREAPTQRAISLMWDLPRFKPREAAYLIAPLIARQSAGTIFVAVVDPGVGTDTRRAVWLEADDHIIVGPDNGLLDVIARRANRARMFEILWRPRHLSSSFHGRDLFAPAAAMLAGGRSPRARALRRRFTWSRTWPEDLDRVIYIDGYGNCMTGRRASTLGQRARAKFGEESIGYARTFGNAKVGESLWYKNSLGLVEIATNRGSARNSLGVEVGDAVAFT